MNPLLVSALCGACALVCAVIISFQEILLGPSAPNYPPGPWWVRGFLFAWMISLAVRGVDILSSLDSPHPQLLALSALASWVLMALAQTAILVVIAKERRPQWFWTRAQKADAKAKGSDACAAASVLAMENAHVAWPHDLPKDTLDIVDEADRRLAQHFAGTVRPEGAGR